MKESGREQPGLEQDSKSTPADRLRAVVDALQNRLPDFISSLQMHSEDTPADSNKRLRLTINYVEDEATIDSKRLETFYELLAAMLLEQNLEIGRLQGYGGNDKSFFVVERVVNGKTNWRRWLRYPEVMDVRVQELLDHVAELVGQQEGPEDQRFTRFCWKALQEGIISRKEDAMISMEMYYTAHGYTREDDEKIRQATKTMN